MSLLQRFMLLSALTLLIGALFIGWWIDQKIVQVVTTDSVDLAGVFVDSTVAPHLAELPSVNAISLAQATHLQQLIRNNVDSGRYVAVNLWDAGGALVYSTLLHPEVEPQDSAGLEAARAGQVYTYQSDTMSTLPGGAGEGPYLETFFPVRTAPDEPVIAVVSFYQNLAALRASVFQSRLEAWSIVATATLLMYFLLFGIVHQGSETIAAQQQALDRSRRQIQQAAVRAAAVNEAAMRRLGADLHDGPAQDLGIALMRMEPLRASITAHAAAADKSGMDADTAIFDLNLIHNALQSSLQEIRNLASGLRLPELADLDIAGSIHKAVTDYTRKTGRAVDVSGPAQLAGNGAVKPAVYRFVQETLNNGNQHGEPAHQTVKYVQQKESLILEVQDDGKGFDPNTAFARRSRRQLGLAGLQERVEILGGTFELQSEPGRGTLVRATLPLAVLADESQADL